MFACFRISDPAKSYFNTQPGCYEDFFPAARNCSCAPFDTIVECTNVEQNITMKSPANIEITTMWESGVICVAPGSSILSQNSSTGSTADYILDPADLFPPFIEGPNARHNLMLSWPTPKGKTEEEVKKYCVNMLTESPVYGDCKTVVNTAFTVQQCVDDIQVT